MSGENNRAGATPGTIQGLLIHGAKQRPDRPFIHFEDGAVCVALRSRPSLTRYWQVARETGATYGVLVSSMAAKLMQNPVTTEERDHAMRFFLASPLPVNADAFIERFGLEGLCSGFGSTEASTALCKRLTQENRRGTCGTAREGFECRIVDADGNDVPDNTRGELIIRPTRRAFLSLGSFNNEAATMRVQKYQLKERGHGPNEWDREQAGVEVKRTEPKATA